MHEVLRGVPRSCAQGARCRSLRARARRSVRLGAPEPLWLGDLIGFERRVDAARSRGRPGEQYPYFFIDTNANGVADPDEARGKASAEAIRSWGLLPHVVLDGVEAMLAIQRMLPAAVVLDAALPKMFGFQVCEVVKRNESLRQTRVVLVGAIHQQDRYRRDPSDLYGADVYIEQPDLPDGLKAIFEEAGMPIGDAAEPPPSPAPAAPSEQSVASPQPLDQQQTPVAPEPPSPIEEPRVEESTGGDEDPEVTAERERAQRLARIAVSEMLLYSPEKFEGAVAAGTLEQVMDLESQEARALLRQRISEEVRAETDFVLDELNRVAAERGGQG